MVTDTNEASQFDKLDSLYKDWVASSSNATLSKITTLVPKLSNLVYNSYSKDSTNTFNRGVAVGNATTNFLITVSEKGIEGARASVLLHTYVKNEYFSIENINHEAILILAMMIMLFLKNMI